MTAFRRGDQVTILPPYDHDHGRNYIWRYQPHAIVFDADEVTCSVELDSTGGALPSLFSVPAARLGKGWFQP